MYAVKETVEFSGKRSIGYKSALSLYPDVWKQDLRCMRKFLQPSPGERILEIGAGCGYFSMDIASAVGPKGRVVVTDPSDEQVAPLLEARVDNIDIFREGADELSFSIEKCDAVWSRGAFHHVRDKKTALERLRSYTKDDGRLVIYDIFAGQRTAQYFDSFVARSCCTGHEVAYFTKEYATTLCEMTGWGTPQFTEVTIPWEFESAKAIGHFLSLLHAVTDDYSEADCLAAAEELLGISTTSSGFALMWPMTVMSAQASDGHGHGQLLLPVSNR
jgi:arsenite methyltransferase